jgi:hypothetical protein
MKSIRKKIDVVTIGPHWGSFTDREHFRRMGFIYKGEPISQTKLLFTRCKVLENGFATCQGGYFIPMEEFEKNTGIKNEHKQGDYIWIACFTNYIGANTKLRPRKIYEFES